MPSQFIAPATIQRSTYTLKARSRNFGGDRADPQEWRPRPGDPDPNRMQSALGTLNADGDFTEVIHLGDCDEVKKITHPVTGNQIKTRVRCEHWDRCKAENLARCYKAEAVAQEKQRKADFAPYIAKLLDAFHRTTTPVTFSEIAKTILYRPLVLGATMFLCSACAAAAKKLDPPEYREFLDTRRAFLENAGIVYNAF